MSIADSRPLKPASLSQYSLRVPAQPSMMDETGHIQTGQLLKLIDISGAITARLHAGPEFQVVTACLDRTDFRQPIQPWNVIVLEGQVTQVWRSSLEVQVKVLLWDFLHQQAGTHQLMPVATSHLVFVGISLIEPPPVLPALSLDTPLATTQAQAADLRKANRMAELKQWSHIPLDRQADPVVLVERPTRPTDANAFRNVFGGVILDTIERTAYRAAVAHVAQVTPNPLLVVARQDRMNFIEPAHIGETLVAQACVTQAWEHSVEIQVDVLALDPATWQHRLVASSFLVYVHLEKNKQSEAISKVVAPVPPWQPKTEAQQQRQLAADHRREQRRHERNVLASAYQNNR